MRWGRSSRPLGVLVAAGALAGFAYLFSLTSGAEPARSSNLLFASSFKDFGRTPQPLSQWRGKTLLVYFWATWCKPCVREVPELIRLYEKYRSRDLEILGIAIDQTDKVRRFSQEYGINYPILIGGNDALELSRKMGNGLGGLPFLVVIDRGGAVVTSYLGEITGEWLEKTVAPLLE